MATTTTTSISGIAATYYPVEDVERATSFWRDVMNLKLTAQFDQGAEFELPDGSAFGLWKPTEEAFHASGWVMFSVPDIQAAVPHFRDRGVEIEGEIYDSPGCMMAFCRDTEGNQFMLHQSKT
ncbi:hypothetical protein EPN52_01500 [bacterium]|nr:MAG: hypothetical protein EPN52_01500 [bacterium]